MKARLLTSLTSLLVLFASPILTAQNSSDTIMEAGPEPWFGVVLPPPFQAHASPVIVGDDYRVRPVDVPVGEENFHEFLRSKNLRGPGSYR